MQRKYTRGFPVGESKTEAKKVALADALAISPDCKEFSATVVESEEHTYNGEFVIVVRWEDGVESV